jgi:hypothetical protein
MDEDAVMMTAYECGTAGGEDRVRVANDLEIGGPEVVDDVMGLGSQVTRIGTAVVAELVEVLRRFHGHGYWMPTVV